MKLIPSTSVGGMAIALQDGTKNGVQMCSAYRIALILGMSMSTVHKILGNILHCYPKLPMYSSCFLLACK